MIDSIWSILCSRYSDLDSWLDLKYLSVNLVEKLIHKESNHLNKPLKLNEKWY